MDVSSGNAGTSWTYLGPSSFKAPFDRFLGWVYFHVGHLFNLTPTKILFGKSPHEILFGKSPNYSYIWVFGSLCYAHNGPRVKDKFSEKSHKCMSMGYPFGKKGWKVYDLETKEMFVSWDVISTEMCFHSPQSSMMNKGTVPIHLFMPILAQCNGLSTISSTKGTNKIKGSNMWRTQKT